GATGVAGDEQVVVRTVVDVAARGRGAAVIGGHTGAGGRGGGERESTGRQDAAERRDDGPRVTAQPLCGAITTHATVPLIAHMQSTVVDHDQPPDFAFPTPAQRRTGI